MAVTVRVWWFGAAVSGGAGAPVDLGIRVPHTVQKRVPSGSKLAHCGQITVGATGCGCAGIGSGAGDGGGLPPWVFVGAVGGLGGAGAPVDLGIRVPHTVQKRVPSGSKLAHCGQITVGAAG